MYPLFETIRYKNRVAENLTLHQERVNYTLKKLGVATSIVLADHIQINANKNELDNKVMKCRFQYDLLGNVNIQFEPYTIKKIDTIAIQDIGVNQYPYKYSDRNWIKDILTIAGTDEVILTQNGYIKDASYANLVFFDGLNWLTPSAPLLMGTRRAALLNAKIIKESPIKIKDITEFKRLKFINAMMLWEESPMIELANIQG